MKAGFWMAPEGAEAPLTVLPIGDPEPARRVPDFLATATAEALIARCPGAAALLPRMIGALARQTAAAPGLLFDLGALTPDEHRLITGLMGSGEVSGVVALPEGVIAQIQESVLAGLWRVQFEDAAGRVLADYAEVSAVPQAVRRAASMTRPALEIGAPPEGAMNVMPLLAEVRARAAAWRAGDAAHAISLTLLPMSDADIAFLQATLGTGPVRLVSRGFGGCRIQATAIHHVWSVQFFNAMDTLLLDTLEICDIPETACAAVEDMRDSTERLREIEEAYFR